MTESLVSKFNSLQKEYLSFSDSELTSQPSDTQEVSNLFLANTLQEWFERYKRRNEGKIQEMEIGESVRRVIQRHLETPYQEQLKRSIKQLLEASQADDELNGLLFFDHRLTVIIGMLAL